MYDENLYKRDVTCSWPPSPLSQTVTPSRALSPLPSSVTYFMDGPKQAHQYVTKGSVWSSLLLKLISEFFYLQLFTVTIDADLFDALHYAASIIIL